KDRKSITLEANVEIINKKENEHKSDVKLARIYDRLLAISFEISKRFLTRLIKLEQGQASVIEYSKVILILLKKLFIDGFQWYREIIFQFLRIHLNKRHKSIINNLLMLE